MTETTIPRSADDWESLWLDSGGHESPDDGMCLMEASPEWGRVARRLARRLRPEGDCLVYTGARSDGYGVINVGGKMLKVHRVVWTILVGPIPEGRVVCHHCDNRPCAYLNHLFLGTVADNNADRHAKGRTVMPTNGPDFWRDKTHCPQGHPYSGDNVRRRTDGRRRCAECYRLREANRRASKRDEINARRRAARKAVR